MQLRRGIYLVADLDAVSSPEALLRVIAQALCGGVVAVQIRAKGAAVGDLIDLCQSALALTRQAGVPLIVNDSLDAALASGADGLHIGQSDMPYAQARALLGPDAIIGLSLEALDQIDQAYLPGLSYVAASPVFATPTKTDIAKPLGLDGLLAMVRQSPVPVVAIGGINLRTIGDVARQGAHCAAIVSAICQASDPAAATEALALAFAQNALNQAL
jgi:thiamine-phosphate pyrophosphorylase